MSRFTNIPDEIKKMAKEISSRRFYRCKGLTPTILQKNTAERNHKD